MAIRTKKYVAVGNPDLVVRALQITEANLMDLVGHICRNGGAATGHLGRPKYNRPARIRIKMRNIGRNWVKYDWRVARVGDYIVRISDDEFLRIKRANFERNFTLA